jgi:type II secretory pathway pseudopilin PulG
MGHGKNRSQQGFTLIAALIIMVLLSGVAVGLLFMVSNENRMSGNDMEANLAYYGAESAMEKLTADLSALYQVNMVPSDAQIQNLVNFPPTPAMTPGINYLPGNIQIIYKVDPLTGAPKSSPATVSAGQNSGLSASIIPMTLKVIAMRPLGASVNITRGIEIALIPVFQFGVFCGYDCSYFAGPKFEFAGRVHTNSNLFLASGDTLVFTDKISAFKQIVMDRLENGYPTAVDYAGTMYLPIASGGCPSTVPATFPPTGANCKTLPGPTTVPGDASWSGGYPGLVGATNPSFPSLSSGTLNGFLINSLTGATNMQLPFVQNSCVSQPPPCTDPIAIIRRRRELSTTPLGSARLTNKAAIRILLADTITDLHPDEGLAVLDADDVHFVPNSSFTIPAGTVIKKVGGANDATAPRIQYYGMADKALDLNWKAPFNYSGWSTWPLLGEVTQAGLPAGGDGAWIRIEYANPAVPSPDAAGHWIGITRDWLGWGFSRQANIPPAGPGSDAVNPNAIIILQQLKSTTNGTSTLNNKNGFYPINFYDTREGEMRDSTNGCAVNGIMNAVELNVANLALWLEHKAPYSADVGNLVPYTTENGYVLYFSDHRGMLTDPYPSNNGATPAGVISGESGLEDVVNSAQVLTSTTPDGVLEGKTYYGYSPEDVDQNGQLDNWGTVNIGYGFNVNTGNKNPYQTVVCSTIGAANAVSGARHVLKLVAGGMNAGTSYLPVRPDKLPAYTGGFTVASENPVYVQGDYNTGTSDPYWTGGSNSTPHSAAAIIADSVTLLSNSWSDSNSLANPDNKAGRSPSNTYYRMAIAAGKNIPFPEPAWTPATNKDFGTDGGMHNFLRLLENWGGTVYYDGSLVSMYYSEYNTGTFKCCTTVYNAPARQFYFDTLFLDPANLPPATPMFQDIVTLSYHQDFKPQ